VKFIDVAQGDAIWIQTHDDGIDGNGKYERYSIIIDGGPYSADNENPLLPIIEEIAHHGADIEALIVTHQHEDHFPGAETLSRHFSIDYYYDPRYPSTRQTYKAFLNAMKGVGGPKRAKRLHIGQRNFGDLNWGSEINAEVLYSWAGNP
jgi:beta-lactamase superfamily II metal-dependent hydrolase